MGTSNQTSNKEQDSFTLRRASTPLHDAIKEAILSGVHSQAHKVLMDEQGGQLTHSTPYSGPYFGFKRTNPYDQPKRDWGNFRAPLRDYHWVIHRIGKGKSGILRADIEQFLAQGPVQSGSRNGFYEQSIAQLMLDHFETLEKYTPQPNTGLVTLKSVVAVAEVVSAHYQKNSARKDNPYILGLADTDFVIAQKQLPQE